MRCPAPGATGGSECGRTEGVRNGSADHRVGEHSMPPRGPGRWMRSRSGGSRLLTCGKVLRQRPRCQCQSEHRHHRGDGRDRHLLERRHARRTVTMGDLENASRLLRGCRLGDEPQDQQPGRTRKRSKAALHWYLVNMGAATTHRARGRRAPRVTPNTARRIRQLAVIPVLEDRAAVRSQ